MNVKIDLSRKLEADVSADELLALFDDLEIVLRKFPKIKTLSLIAEHSYQFEMQTIGSSIARIAHDAIFACRFEVDKSKGELRWKALTDVGNTRFNGVLRRGGKGLIVEIKGDVLDVPIPMMYRLVAPAFIQGKFSALADVWLQRLATAAKPNKKKSTRAAA